MQDTQPKEAHDTKLFFILVGGACILVGALVALFNLMYDPITSAFAAIIFFIIGGFAAMYSVMGYLADIDEKFYNKNSKRG